MGRIEFNRLDTLDYEIIRQIIDIEIEAFENHGLTEMSIIPMLQFQFIFYGKVNNQVVCEAQLIEDRNVKDDVFLFGFAVKKSFQKQNVGKEFIKNIEAYLSKTHKKLKLYVDPKGSIEFYKRCGYEVQETYEDFYFKGNDRVLMYKNI